VSAEQIQDADVVPETGTDVVPATGAAVIFRTEDPMEIMEQTAKVATALKKFVKEQGLMSNISGRDYVVVEGWQMLGMMLGVTPGKVNTRPVEQGWEATVELHDRNGRIIGQGDAECLETEKLWSKRDDYARKSMAQTRAIAKAFRNTFGFIAKAAGFEATPAEEMPSQQSQPAGPAFGPPASPEVATSGRNAIAWVLGEAPNSEPVTMLLAQIEARAGGYFPEIAARAIGHVAAAAKAAHELEEPPTDDDAAADQAARTAAALRGQA
jgi:hypothetical protein